MMPKGSQNRCQNRHLGDQGARLLSFRGMFLGKRFFNNFEATQTSTKKLKNATKNKKKTQMHYFINFVIFHNMRQPPECFYT